LERKVQFVDNSNANASSLLGYVATQPLFAVDGPNILNLIKRFERRDILWKIKPRQFAARKDVNIRLDRSRIIKRAGAN
jgi:hypothetical protein